MKIIACIVDGISDFVGKTAARYRDYVERANAEARAAAKANEYADMAVASRVDYELIAEMLAEAINNTVDATHLLPIKDLSQLFCEPWLGRLPSGVWSFQYHGRYVKGYGITAEAVQRILQSELNRLCRVYQYPALTVHVTFAADCAVNIKVAFTNDLRAARNTKV